MVQHNSLQRQQQSSNRPFKSNFHTFRKLGTCQVFISCLCLSCRNMDLVTLLASCPPLLDACVSGETSTFRALRGVNKEASRLILKAHLRHYKLTLKGKGRDTKDGVARLLLQTRLQSLHADLVCWPGMLQQAAQHTTRFASYAVGLYKACRAKFAWVHVLEQ